MVAFPRAPPLPLTACPLAPYTLPPCFLPPCLLHCAPCPLSVPLPPTPCSCSVEYVVQSSPTCCPTLVTVETMLQYAPHVRRHADKYFEAQREAYLATAAPRSKL